MGITINWKNRRTWVLGGAIFITIIGMLLTRWHLWLIDLVKMFTTGTLPEQDITGVTLGGALLVLAPILFNLARNLD